MHLTGSYREVLQQLKMELWDTAKCNSSLAWDGKVFDTTLCAGYYSGAKSICKVRPCVPGTTPAPSQYVRYDPVCRVLLRREVHM